ncbi:MAG: hypothetical protein AAGA28_17785 [Pseudomonadota bacterium]
MQKKYMGLPGSFLCFALCSTSTALASELTLPTLDNAPIEDRFHIGKRSFSEVSESWRAESVAPFLDAFGRFESLSSCGVHQGDTFALAWEEFSTAEEIRVCLFLLAEFFRTPDQMRKWFDEQGFHTHLSSETVGFEDKIPLVLHASIRLHDERGPNLIGEVFRYARANHIGFSLGIFYDETIRPKSAEAALNWN